MSEPRPIAQVVVREQFYCECTACPGPRLWDYTTPTGTVWHVGEAHLDLDWAWRCRGGCGCTMRLVRQVTIPSGA